MNNKLNALWDEMLNYAKNKKSLDDIIVIHEDRKNFFIQSFYYSYNEFKSKNMKPEVVYLDRHKVAAILIETVIKTEIMEYNSEDNAGVYLENYYLALSIGLSYMQYEAKIAYKDKNGINTFKLSFPDVFFGDKNYKEYLVNMLYLSNKENSLDIYALANILFLIEIHSINMMELPKNKFLKKVL